LTRSNLCASILLAACNPAGRSAGAAHSRASEFTGLQIAPASGTGRRCVRFPRHELRIEAMKFVGDIVIDAARDAVFAKVRDARFFASCVEGVRDLNAIDADHYTAVLETKVAYLRFKFNVAVEVVRIDSPREIEARIEGTPLGIVGRLTASSITRLVEQSGATTVSYEIEAALTGKLGSLGQPVLRAKAKEMERQFAERLRAAFASTTSQAAS
jgi:carbon monoxide dehydrogenase subunit G